MNFRELSDVIAHTGIVTKVHLANHCDDYAGAEDDDDFLEEKDKSIILPCKLSQCTIAGW